MGQGTGFAGGYDVEIAKRVAEGLGKELVIVPTQWDGLVPALTSGSIDAIIAGMSPTEERRQVIDFTDPYYESRLVVVTRKNSEFANATSLADFAGAKIGIPQAEFAAVQRQVQPLLTGVQRIQPVADGPRHGVEGATEPADFVVAFSHQS